MKIETIEYEVEFAIDIDQYKNMQKLDITLEYCEKTVDQNHFITEIYFPYYIKSAKRTTSLTKDRLKEHAINTLKSNLVQKYKNILLRDYNHREHYKAFIEVIQSCNSELRDCDILTEYSNGLYHQDKIAGISTSEIFKKMKYEKCKKFSDIPKNYKPELEWGTFLNMILKDNCGYCGISVEKIYELAKKKQLFTKRSRGYVMEVDQINAYGFYSDNNCITSCYWCNNAKTDEFTYQDFKVNVAPGIKKIWESRLKTNAKEVYFSKLLSKRYPEFSNNLLNILKRYDIDYEFIDGTKDIWMRDYMPLRLN